MELRGIDFGPCWDAAGVRGWFGEGYWFHQLAPFWYNFSGSTRVAKTTTIDEQKGHMPIHGPERDFAPKGFFPKAIWCDWRRNIALNAIGLSGPGTRALIENRLLTRDTAPFMISFMPVGKTSLGRLEECRCFVELIKLACGESSVRFGLQFNLSCPSTGLNPSEIVREGREFLNIGSTLGVPLVVKLNVLAPHGVAKEIADHGNCDALCISNTIPFGELPKKVNWKELFPKGSPLARRGCPPGGLSGTLLLPIVIDWVRQARDMHIDIPLNVGGGITHSQDVKQLVKKAKLRRRQDSIFIGSIAMLRPWNIRSVIREAYRLLD